MVTLMEYRKIEDAYNKEIEHLKKVTSASRLESHANRPITTQEELDRYRDLMAERIKYATNLVEQQIEIKESFIKLGRSSSYLNVTFKCSSCGNIHTSLENLYVGFDFKTAMCGDCKDRLVNKDKIQIIDNAKNIKGEFDNDNNLIAIKFESNGKQFAAFNERKDGYKNILTLEEE